MGFFNAKSEEELKKEWERTSKNKWVWIFVKGVISYGIPLGLVVYLALYFTDSVPKDDLSKLIQVIGVFIVFGIFRAIYRYNFFSRKYSKK